MAARSDTAPSRPHSSDIKSSEKPLPSRSATTKTKRHVPLHLPKPSHQAHHASTSHNSPPPPRPALPPRLNSVQTRYINMLLDLDTIPRMHNIYASFFTWVVLAGFLILPGTFTSLATLTNDPTVADSTTASDILDSVKHVSLLYVGAFCAGLGTLGMIWLWFRWRGNYVWLLNRIFLPGFLNSFAGLISTLVNVYSQQDSKWSVTAWVTAAVTGACMVITGGLFALYNFWLLAQVKKRHQGEMEAERVPEEGLVEKLQRKKNEPALEPGSVV